MLKQQPTFDHPALPPPFHTTFPTPLLITQGAEAHVLKTVFLDANNPAALKIRPSKQYRHPTLDQRLTKQRVLAEARILVKLANSCICVPRVYALDWHVEDLGKSKGEVVLESGVVAASGGARVGAGAGAWLLMEWIEGRSVRQLLQERDRLEKAEITLGDSADEDAVRRLLRRVGRAVGDMHTVGGVVHGDLTSSNIMIRPMTRTGQVDGIAKEADADADLSLEGEIVLIDFGLATQSIQDEDRAVDLYVLERAFGSTHPKQEAMFAQEVLESQEGYRGSFKGSKVVLKRLEEVRLRGRKRSMVG
jgi:TP53 regulating kinase and related kinases